MSALHAQIEKYLVYLADERRVAARTVETYTRDLKALCTWLESPKSRRPVSKRDAAALDVRDLRAFLASFGTSEPATVIRRLAALRSFYRFMLKRGGLKANPATALTAPKLRRKLPTFLPVEEMGETIEKPTELGSDAVRLRDRAMMEVLYGAGVRVSELVGLDLARIDLDGACAKVLGKGSKERIVPLGAQACAALRAYLPVRGELLGRDGSQDPDALFLSAKGVRIPVRQVQLLVKRYGMLATGSNALHPHALRHSCATHLLDAGADLRSIQELLGHASLSTTQRYTHVSTDQLQAVYAKAHPLAQRKP